MLSGNLLDDTVVLILSRLPATSLIRFKAVSKPWCQHIECPQFITEHYQTRAALGNNSCLLIKLNRRNHSHFSLVYNHSPTWSGLKDLHRSRDSDTFVSLCNGIFCVIIDLHTVQLWNPAIRQYMTLPRSLMPNLEPPHNFYCSYDLFGLNFDPKSNEYKVVRIWVFSRRMDAPRPRSMGDYMNKVEVWTPRNNSWRLIDVVPPIPLLRYDDTINLNGRCYWLAGRFGSMAIVSFDMIFEVFHATPLPNALYTQSGDSYKHIRVTILNESIAVFSNPLQHNPKSFDVWLMNGGDCQGCWSKYMTVEMPPLGSFPEYWNIRHRKPERHMMYPLAFWNNGELILNDKFGRLVFLNTSTGKTIHSELRINVLHQIYVYNESLVSINDWME